MVDHEVAHVHVTGEGNLAEIRCVLESLDGVECVLEREGMAARGADHAASGELMLVAEEGRWLAYPWWRRGAEAPDYASHIDIHRKPGFDPCEMFLGGWPPGVSQRTERIRGTHGRWGRRVAWGADVAFAGTPESIPGLGVCVCDWLMDNG